MIDSLNQKIEKDDYVMFVTSGSRTLVLGIVVKATPKGATIRELSGSTLYPRNSNMFVKINQVLKENPELLI